MSDPSGDRVHDATPTRLERAKREGDLPRSADLAFAIQMCGVIGLMWLLSGGVSQWLSQSTTQAWSATTVRADSFDAAASMQRLIFSGAMTLAPILLLMMAVGVSSWWLQTGPLLIADKPAPDMNRMSPTHWFDRLFSLSNMTFPLIGLPRALLALLVAGVSCWWRRNDFYLMANLPADAMVRHMFELVLSTAMHVAVTLLLTSIADYGLRWVSHQQHLRMSEQELRDEQKMQGSDNPFRTAQTMPKSSS